MDSKRQLNLCASGGNATASGSAVTLPVLSVRWIEDSHDCRTRARKRGAGLKITRRPRARGAGRPKAAAPTRRRISGGRNGPPDDDGSGCSQPPAGGRRTVYTFACLSPEQRGEGT